MFPERWLDMEKICNEACVEAEIDPQAFTELCVSNSCNSLSLNIDDLVEQKLKEKFNELIDVVKLPTDISLRDEEFLAIGVDVGDMSQEEANSYCQSLINHLKAKGLTKIFVYQKSYKRGGVSFSKISSPPDFYLE